MLHFYAALSCCQNLSALNARAVVEASRVDQTGRFPLLMLTTYLENLTNYLNEWRTYSREFSYRICKRNEFIQQPPL